MRDSKTLFAKTPPVRLFLTTAIPGVISMLTGSLYALIDGVFVGQMLGETSFAALNLAFPFVLINFSLADLIGVGSAVLIATHLGRKQEAEANNYFTCACLMIVATGVLMGAVLFAAAPAMIGAFGAEGDLAAFAVLYLRTYALFSPATTILFAMDNFLRICGRIRGSMLLNILLSAAAIVLEFLFLYVFRWNVAAAALANCLAMLLCTGIAVFPFLRGQMLLRFCRPRFSFRMVRQILFSGSPTFLSNVAGRLTSIIMNALLLRWGGQSAVSVYGVLMYSGDLVQPVLYGLCDSLQPAVSYNWGAKNIARVRALEVCCFTASAAVSFAAAAGLFFFPGQIASLFVQPGDTALLAASTAALRLFSLTYLTRWFGFAAQSCLTALDKPLPASLLSVANAFLFPVLLMAALRPLKLTGIWLNFPLTSALVAALAAVLLIRAKRWAPVHAGEERQGTAGRAETEEAGCRRPGGTD